MIFSSALLANPPCVCLPRKFPVRCSSVPVSAASQLRSTQFDLKTYWTTLITEIDQNLEKAITVKYPEQIYESMRYSVLAKGTKRAPPVMCVAACELFGVNRIAAFPTACALEMVRFVQLIFVFVYWHFYYYSFCVGYEEFELGLLLGIGRCWIRSSVGLFLCWLFIIAVGVGRWRIWYVFLIKFMVLCFESCP